MTLRYMDVESMVEDAFISVLSAQPYTSGFTVKIWDDNKDLELNPIIRIKATEVSELGGTMNTYAASNVIVDLAVFSTKRIDNNGRTASTMRSNIRDVIIQSDIVSVFNALSAQTSGLNIYSNGIIPQTSFQNDDDKVYQKGISVLVVCTTTDI